MWSRKNSQFWLPSVRKSINKCKYRSEFLVTYFLIEAQLQSKTANSDEVKGLLPEGNGCFSLQMIEAVRLKAGSESKAEGTRSISIHY